MTLQIPVAWMLLAESPGQTPVWAVWLFEKPITSALVLGIAALIVVVVLHRRGLTRPAMIAAGVGVLLAAGVFATGRLVTTDRERIIAGAREFVAAVAESDPVAVSDLLDDRLVVTTNSDLVVGAGKDRVISITRGIESLGIRSHFFRLDRAATPRSGLGTTEIGVQVSTTAYGNATSRWKLEWQRGADGNWRITEINCLSLGGFKPDNSWLTRAPGG